MSPPSTDSPAAPSAQPPAAAGMAPRQLLLRLVEAAPPTLENFVSVGNEEAVAALRLASRGEGPQFICLWGPPGSGRSHLLRALTPRQERRVPDFEPGRELYTVDDVESLGEEDLQRLFTLMNETRACPRARLVCAASAPPESLTLREDVRSRLSWGLVFAIRLLPGDLAREEFLRRCAARGISLSPAVSDWIADHCPRDIAGLTRLLNVIDSCSLSRQRQVTISLLREQGFGLTEAEHAPAP